MNILSVNKYCYAKGGAETYYFSLNRLLREKGYEVTLFSMKNARNAPTPFDRYFADPVDYDGMTFSQKLRYGAKLIYSVEARRKIEGLIRDKKPDIAHLQNFYHQLSPSILAGIGKYGIPIVFTAHDLKLLCPNYQMLCRGQICEKCKGHSYYRCAENRCMKNSLPASLVGTAEAYLHQILKSYSKIDVIITPSAFYKRKFSEFGFPPEKIEHIPNFIDTALYKPNYCVDGYIAYIGRLSAEKGILTLLKAMKRIKSAELYLIGDGPLRPEIEQVISREGLDNVRLLGFRSGKELEELIRNCYLAVLPSEWYENAPLSVLEAMACGKPVVGADTGGIPELVLHGRTGLVFEPGNAEQLSERLGELCSDSRKAVDMGREARKRIESEFGREKHFERIEAIYKRLLRDPHPGPDPATEPGR